MIPTTRFVADESCDFAVVRALREAGYEVLAIAEIEPRAPDEAVLARAVEGSAVVVTEDRDFGRLVFAERRQSTGVVYLRFPAGDRLAMAAAAVELAQRLGDELHRLFVTLTDQGPRVRPLPGR